MKKINLESIIENVSRLKKAIEERTGSKYFLAGAETARGLLELWYSAREDVRKKWKEKFPYHHGLYGLIYYVLGLSLSRIERMDKIGKFLEGLGAILMLDDIGDINEWFKKG